MGQIFTILMGVAIQKQTCYLLALLSLGFSLVPSATGLAQSASLPVPAGLESAVEFWKQIFTRYGSADAVFFDPLDPGKIYSVVRAAEDEQGRALLEKARVRIAADNDLADDETRIRTQRGAKEHFLEGLKISGRYISQMKKIFREEGLPEDLAYLPLVESSFNIRARSSAGAVGMWQFMPDTGKKFMRIDAAVDERRDPMTSTRAAARLLKENYQILGNWPLAITAYNHGPDGLFRGIKAVESDDLVDLIRGYQSPTFGFASKNFYAELLAVVDIATNAEAYFPFLRPHRPVALREIEVRRQARLDTVLKPAAISQSDFFSWNPALEPAVKFIPLGYKVKLPPEKVDDFLAAHRRAMVLPQKTRVTSGGRSRSRQPNAIGTSTAKAGTSMKKKPTHLTLNAKPPGKSGLSGKKSSLAPAAQLKLTAR